MPGILDNKNEDVTITRKMGNGSSVTYKSPNGSQIDMSGLLGQMSNYAQGGQVENYQMGGMLTGSAPSPVADNKMVNVTPGEFVVNQPAAQKYKDVLEQINNEGKQMLAEGGWTDGPVDQHFAQNQAPAGYKSGMKDTESRYAQTHQVLQDLYEGASNDAEEAGWIKEFLENPAELSEFIGGEPNEETMKSLQYRWEELKPAYESDYGPVQEGAPATAADLYEGDYTPPAQGYWTGGEVEGEAGAGATPDEGDTFTTKGQTLYYKGGNWVYSKGSKAPGYALKDLDAKLNPVVEPTNSFDATPDQVAEPYTGKLTAGQSKEFGWGKRAIEAEKAIRALAAEGYNPASLGRSKQELVAGLLGDSDLFRDEQGQKYRRAVEAFVAAVLRKDTGAQISPTEHERVLTEMFPNLGSTTGTQEQLGNQRTQAIQSFIKGAGKAGPELQEQLGDTLETSSVAEDDRIVTGEDILGITGGIGGAIGGSKAGSKKFKGGGKGKIIGSMLGAAAGTFGGRGVAETAETGSIKEGFFEPEVNDYIDTAISTALPGGGASIRVITPFIKSALADLVGAVGMKNLSKQLIGETVQKVIKEQAPKVAGESAGLLAEQATRGAVKGLKPQAGLLGPSGNLLK